MRFGETRSENITECSGNKEEKPPKQSLLALNREALGGIKKVKCTHALPSFELLRSFEFDARDCRADCDGENSLRAVCTTGGANDLPLSLRSLLRWRFGDNLGGVDCVASGGGGGEGEGAVVFLVRRAAIGVPRIHSGMPSKTDSSPCGDSDAILGGRPDGDA